MCVVPVLIAILSSPLSIQLWATVTLVEDPGSMPSVFRASIPLVVGQQMNSPRRKAIGLVDADVKVRRIVQRYPVEHQAVGMVGHDHPRRKVSFILGLSLARHLPPAIVLAQKLRVAAPVDN